MESTRRTVYCNYFTVSIELSALDNIREELTLVNADNIVLAPAVIVERAYGIKGRGTCLGLISNLATSKVHHSDNAREVEVLKNCNFVLHL